MYPEDGEYIVTLPEDAAGAYNFFNMQEEDTPTGKLIVQKVFADENGDPEQLFGITVTPEDENLDPLTGEISVEKSAEFDLPPGFYTVSEDTPLPENYSLVGISPDQPVEVVEGETVIVIITNQYTPENPPSFGALEIRKQLQGTGGSNTAQFGYSVSGPDGYSATGNVSVNSPVVLEGLLPGEYTVTETSYPASYTVVTGQVTVTVVANEKAVATLVNEYSPDVPPPPPPPSPSYGALEIRKAFQGTGGDDDYYFEYTVTGPAGFSLNGTVSVNDWDLITDLVPGTYTVTEINVPAQYNVINGSFTVQVVEDQTSVVTLVNGVVPPEEEEEEEEEPDFIEVTPEPAEVQEEEEIDFIEVTPEPAEVPDEEIPVELEMEPELPKTGAMDLLLLMGAVIAGGGLAIRRKRR